MVTMIVMAASVALIAPQPAAAKSRHAGHRPTASGRPPEPVAQLAVKVPLPQPRPAEAPQREMAKGGGRPSGPQAGTDHGTAEVAKGEAGKDEAKAPEPSACRLALTDEVAIAPSIPPIRGPGACGGEDLVRLESVVLPNKRRVALTPVATMRCTMATAVVNWIRDDVAPLMTRFGSEITALDNFDSYQCRGRNGKSDGPLSEHAKANAIDVHGFKLADGRMIELTDRTQPRDLRESVLHSACTRFPTVLGPDSDGYHEDHIHLDLIERRNNYRICQWDVLDPLPKVAPLMPEARPGEAPPRVVAEAGQGEKVDKATGQGKDQAAEKGAEKAAAPTDKTAAKEADTSGGKDARPVTAAPDNSRRQAAPPAVPEAAPATPPPDSKGAADKAPDKAADRPATGKERQTADKAAADEAKPGPGKSAGKSAGRKAAADRSAARKRRHSRHLWNPFGALF
jgi:hypothetical protein